MSGLEKAIRNALAQSERNNADIRARIYHSARQALDAGLRKQDVTDPDLIDAQRQRLEAKIREIEFEERQRLAIERSQMAAQQDIDPQQNSVTPDASTLPPIEPAMRNSETAPGRHQQDASIIGGESRDAPDASTAGDLGDLGVSRRGGTEQPAELRPRREIAAEKPRRKSWWQRKHKAAPARPAPQPSTPRDARLDVAAGKEGRPRKRRRWISGLVLPLVVLGGAGWGVWWAGNNGLIVMPDLSDTAVTGSGGTTSALPGFEPGRGFSEEWAEVYVPKGTDGIVASGNARVEAVSASGGQAVRVTSQSPGPDGEVAIDVPSEILREMAGKSSTVAITLQAAGNRSVEVAIRCDFGSLGGCSRHRFQATQEKSDALFRVNFDRTLAPNRAGRIYLNSDVLGGKLPVYVFSMRILPGQ